jgi:hypothetical protein
MATILKDDDGNRYYGTTLYPLIDAKITDIYLITTVGDRLDILANTYYGNATQWRVIASANNISKDSIFIKPGTQIRIPMDLKAYNAEFNRINDK